MKTTTNVSTLIKEPNTKGEPNSLFIDFLVKETELDNSLMYEYIELYRAFTNNEGQKSRSGDRLWTLEEKMLFKLFYNHLRSKTRIKGILESFSQINGRTPGANQFHFYQNRSFYDDKASKKQMKSKHLKTAKEQTTKTTKEEIVIPSTKLANTKEEFHSKESSILVEKEEKTMQLEITSMKTIEQETTTKKEGDTLLSDVQTTLENLSKLGDFDISGLFSGLSTLSQLALNNETDKEELQTLKEQAHSQEEETKAKDEKILYLEQQLRYIHESVARFDSCDSIYKITKLGDFLNELKDLSK